MSRRFFISMALVLLIFVAGCLGGGRTKTEIVSEDMLKIKNVDIFPSKTLQPEDTIVIRMEVENAGQDATYLLVDKDNPGKDKADKNWDGDYLLMDHCGILYRPSSDSSSKFQILSGGRCVEIYDASDTGHKNPKIPLVKDSNGNEIGNNSCYLKLSPQQSHTFQWTLKAPKEGEIAKMTQKCTFKFQTAYAARAVTNTYVYFADPLEVAQRLYTQKEMALAGDNIASYGPIAVNFESAQPQPIPAKKGGTWTVFLNLKNAGEGIADVNSIAIDLPEGIETYKIDHEDQCMMGGKLSDNDLNEKIALLEHLKTAPVGQTVRDELKERMNVCSEHPISCAEYIALIEKYDAICKSGVDESFCGAAFPDIAATLESQKSKLQISKEASSRIPCELTIPGSVTILTPFKFVTTADYTYKIRQDIEITTKPIKEVA